MKDTAKQIEKTLTEESLADQLNVVHLLVSNNMMKAVAERVRVTHEDG